MNGSHERKDFSFFKKVKKLSFLADIADRTVDYIWIIFIVLSLIFVSVSSKEEVNAPTAQEIQPEIMLEQDNLNTRLGEVLWLAERKLNISFRVRPGIFDVHKDELKGIRKEAFARIYKKHFPDLPDKQIMSKAEFDSASVHDDIAQYLPGKHAVFVLGNALLEKFSSPSYRPSDRAEFLRIILAWAIFLAYEEEKYQSLTRMLVIEKPVERAFYRAFVLGYAVFQTKRFVESTGDWKLFEAWRRKLVKTRSDGLFTYKQVPDFFEEMLKKEGESIFNTIFRTPPKTREEVIHPEKYTTAAAVVPVNQIQGPE